jgi:hypothetical protein
MESLLGKEEVLSGKSKIMAQKDHNFWSDRWITLKFLQEFSDVVFFGVAMESLRGDEEVLSVKHE